MPPAGWGSGSALRDGVVGDHLCSGSVPPSLAEPGLVCGRARRDRGCEERPSRAGPRDGRLRLQIWELGLPIQVSARGGAAGLGRVTWVDPAQCRVRCHVREAAGEVHCRFDVGLPGGLVHGEGMEGRRARDSVGSQVHRAQFGRSTSAHWTQRCQFRPAARSHKERAVYV